MTEHTDDGPDNLILRRLREIDRKQDVLLDRLDNLTTRVSALEGVIGLLVTQMATLNARVDNFDRRLERVERRLNLVDAPA
jgi:chromosome segregation ATPase